MIRLWDLVVGIFWRLDLGFWCFDQTFPPCRTHFKPALSCHAETGQEILRLRLATTQGQTPPDSCACQIPGRGGRGRSGRDRLAELQFRLTGIAGPIAAARGVGPEKCHLRSDPARDGFAW